MHFPRIYKDVGVGEGRWYCVLLNISLAILHPFPRPSQHTPVSKKMPMYGLLTVRGIVRPKLNL
jgi:hypothetical protein